MERGSVASCDSVVYTRRHSRCGVCEQELLGNLLFGLNPWTAPGGIGLPHPANQRDEFAVDGGSSLAGTGFPAPEKAKAKTMPSDDGLGLEEEQSVMPAR